MNRVPSFKAKVASEALKEGQTVIELPERYQDRPNWISEWKRELQDHASEIFVRDRKTREGPNLKDLRAKIGQLAMPNDYEAEDGLSLKSCAGRFLMW